jgi:hypothetical protein
MTVQLLTGWGLATRGQLQVNVPQITLDYPAITDYTQIDDANPPATCQVQIECDQDTLTALQADVAYQGSIEVID